MKTPIYKSELLHAETPDKLKDNINAFLSMQYDIEPNGWKLVSIGMFKTQTSYVAIIYYAVEDAELETLEHYEERIEWENDADKIKEYKTGIACPDCGGGIIISR